MNRLPLIVAGLGLLLAGCSRQTPPPEPVRAVKVVRVGTDAWASGQEFAGEVRARVESRLGFRLNGKISSRSVEVGQRVKAGQLLAQLDPTDYRLAVDAARAQVDAARIQRDLAAADLRRFQALKDQNFISGAELERREATFKAAQSQLEQAQAQLAVQGNQAAYASLRADVAGVVTAVEAEAGQVVSAGMPVVRIAADGARDVVFSVPEDKVSSVRPGQKVGVRPWAQSAEQPARVREVAASADPLTRTFVVKAALDAASTLPLGATATVVFPGLGAQAQQGQPVIKLPTTALRQEGQGSAVWVLDEERMSIRSQAVQVASVDGQQAVIAAGLQPGQLVVSAGVHVLTQGQKVSLFGGTGADGARPPASAPAASPLPAAQ